MLSTQALEQSLCQVGTVISEVLKAFGETAIEGLSLGGAQLSHAEALRAGLDKCLKEIAGQY